MKTFWQALLVLAGGVLGVWLLFRLFLAYQTPALLFNLLNLNYCG